MEEHFYITHRPALYDFESVEPFLLEPAGKPHDQRVVAFLLCFPDFQRPFKILRDRLVEKYLLARTDRFDCRLFVCISGSDHQDKIHIRVPDKIIIFFVKRHRRRDTVPVPVPGKKGCFSLLHAHPCSITKGPYFQLRCAIKVYYTGPKLKTSSACAYDTHSGPFTRHTVALPF